MMITDILYIEFLDLSKADDLQELTAWEAPVVVWHMNTEQTGMKGRVDSTFLEFSRYVK